MSIQMPQRGSHRNQMHSTSDDSSTPNSNPDLPNAHEAQSRATHARSAQSRAAHTRVEARQGITPCPAHTREAPAGSHRGHRKHVSSMSSNALRAVPGSSSYAMAERKYPNRDILRVCTTPGVLRPGIGAHPYKPPRLRRQAYGPHSIDCG